MKFLITILTLSLLTAFGASAAEDTPGLSNSHGQGATVCDYNCRKPAHPGDRNLKSLNEDQMAAVAACAIDPQKCSDEAKRRLQDADQ